MKIVCASGQAGPQSLQISLCVQKRSIFGPGSIEKRYATETYIHIGEAMPFSLARTIGCGAIALIFFVCAIGVTAKADEQIKTIVLSSIENDPPITQAIEILKRAYEKIRISVRIEFLPGLRALTWANEGYTTGDVGRVAGTEERFRNLVKVPVPVAEITAVAYGTNPELIVNKWEDLKPLQVGIVRGIQISEIKTRNFRRTSVSDVAHLIKMLEAGRIDAAVFSPGVIEKYLASAKGKSKIVALGEPLEVIQLYHYLNKRHSSLVPIVAKSIEEVRSK